MKVDFKNNALNFTEVSQDDAELLMMALEDLSNRLYKKSNNPNKTSAEIEVIKSDKMKVTMLYRMIERQYDQHLAKKPEFEEVDVRVYDEPLVR